MAEAPANFRLHIVRRTWARKHRENVWPSTIDQNLPSNWNRDLEVDGEKVPEGSHRMPWDEVEKREP